MGCDQETCHTGPSWLMQSTNAPPLSAVPFQLGEERLLIAAYIENANCAVRGSGGQSPSIIIKLSIVLKDVKRGVALLQRTIKSSC